MVPLYVGIDGGGTRTTALVTDESGTELARLEGDAGIVQTLDPAAGAATLADLARYAAAEAGEAGTVAALCCALAGAGREPERRALEDALRALHPAERVLVTTDAEAALRDALGTGPGMLLIAGTGSIAWGRAADGTTARAGGWGQLLGDEGSGYALGLGALQAVVRMHDGRGPATTLGEPVLRAAGVPAPEGLVAFAAGASKADVAALAPLVADAAAAGDGVAAALVADAAHELALHVAALRRRLPAAPQPLPVALAGGLLAPGGPLRDPTSAAIHALGLAVHVLDRAVDGARGAAAIARDLAVAPAAGTA